MTERNLCLYVRVYLREGDRKMPHGGMLLDTLVRLLVDECRLSGFTVFRGVVGYGQGGVVRESDLLHMNARLPLVLEFFGDEDKIRSDVLPRLRDYVDRDHIVFWPAERP